MPNFKIKTLCFATMCALLQGCIHVNFFHPAPPLVDEEEAIFGFITPGKTPNNNLAKKISAMFPADKDNPSCVVGGNDNEVHIVGCYDDKYIGGMSVIVNSFGGTVSEVQFTFGDAKFAEYTQILNERYGAPFSSEGAKFWKTPRGIVKMTTGRNIGSILYTATDSFQIAALHP